MIRTFKADNPSIDDLDLIYYAKLILDRVLFIAFAEDTGLLPENSLKKAYQHQDPYQPRPIWENFKGLFQAINKGNSQLNIPAYNGGLFQEDTVLNQLVVSDALSEQFKQIGEYDFESEVSVTVLGYIFEQSISDLEELRTEAQEISLEKVGKRKREGVVYTPDNITRFMVEATLGRYLTEQFNQLWNARHQQRYQRGDQKGAWKKSLDEITFWRDYQDALRAVKVVDPACGSGAFLVAAFDYLHAEYLRVNDQLQALTGSYGIFDLDKEILNQNLYGVDINSESIEITKLSLWLKTAKRGKVLTSLDHNLRMGDSLIEDSNISQRAFSWQLAFPEVFAAGGFDVVLGNPPYVRQELISSLKPYLQKQYQIYHGVADLYTYFFERGLGLLKPQGKLGFICSSTFFKTGSGEPLRHYLATHTTIETIVDFGDLQVFAGVTTYPAILVLKKIKPNESHLLEFLKLHQLPTTELSKIFHLHKSTMPQAWLSQDSWRLEEAKLVQLRQKIVSGKPTLKAVYGSPYRGILTGFNEAFVIDKATRDKLVAQDPKSTEVIKPFLEGKDLKKWRVESRELYLILIPKGWTQEKSNITDEQLAWTWLNTHYPAIAQWLVPFEVKAKKRVDKGEFWWELRACAYYPEFEKEKIVYPDISQHAQFSLDIQKCYFGNTGYFIPNGNLFLVGLLNAKVIWLYLYGVSNSIRGGFIRLFSQYIEKIPIPTATDPQKTEIATLAQQCQHLAETRYQKQEAIRHRIPDICPTNREPELSTKLKTWWTLDFKAFREEIKKCFKTDIPLVERNDWEIWLNTEKAAIEQLNQQLAQLEQQLNQKVYELFELTEEEIRLVEDNI
ncbi:type I restriction-modification system methyltransferase subunit [Thioploca ingrica]|uniref:site-specific DNA-methyltransferase (adenine-specific) n=1 Tax=Thioploca ingrica TaxID=40754 RepID=A0A090BUB3_9GAMM|nr:type I restriction-modification system methyltransferase subunit [Thioploca ingrica]